MGKIVLIGVFISAVFLGWSAVANIISSPTPSSTPTSKSSPKKQICSRKEPYSIPPEFDRAISLILQRYEQTNVSPGFARAITIKTIRNCLDIQYATSDDELQDAEGVFAFTETGTKDRLQILVSPRYQAKDDLLTATLLSHELAHASLYAFDKDKEFSCFENEADAFREQLGFISTLNYEEIASLTYRYNNRSSPEAVAVIELLLNVRNQPPYEPPSEETAYKKALNYVKTHPFYQKLCAGR